MRIKRFEAENTQTALAMVKEEMGEDAVILATRTLSSGGKGPRGRIEIVAAMDYDLEELVAPSAEPENEVVPEGPSPVQTYGYHTVRRQSSAPADDGTVSRNQESAAEDQSPDSDDKKALHSEAHDLCLRFANVFRRPLLPAKPKAVTLKKPSLPSQPGTAARKPDPAQVKEWRAQIVDKIQLPDKSALENGSPEIIALVGATGVGKTTTAAKLAAWHSLRQGQRVALLSMDCYRIGATDQLRTYARIMRLPCEVVLRKIDLGKALARHHDKDIIIIDTAGKSPYDQQHILELNDWFAPCQTISPHLVLSATAKKEDLQTIIKAYDSLSVSSLVLTKLDETRAYAALCQQVVASRLPVSYLCTGQRVPEDFMVASKDFLDTLFKQGWPAAVDKIEATADQYIGQ